MAEAVGAELGVTRLANVTGMDNVGVPVWVAIRPLSYSLTVSQGKGLTNDLAKVSALMESIELAHAEQFESLGPYKSFAAYINDNRYMPPHQLPLRAGVELADVSDVNWIQCRTLDGCTERYIPSDLFRLDFRFGDNKGPFLGTSNGLASGNSFEEAVLHGVCEVIERDQVSFSIVGNSLGGDSFNTELDVHLLADPDLQWLCEKIETAGLLLRVWYATTNIDIPTFIALVHGPDQESLYPIRAKGFGSHPLKKIALCRAITEALQSRLTYISGSRDDRLWKSYSESRSRNVSDEFITPSSVSLTNFNNVPEYQGEIDVRTMLDWVLEKNKNAGLEDALIVDLTRNDFKLPVVWVFIPELEHYGLQPDYIPGRRMSEFIKKIPVLQ
ncbi:MAG: hypothetical protein DHS20C01_31950 [marine bacterium B5-7]|nr:MAG: hypothetical protein DHS20C01_31950 [marine bacterium B5-7]